MLKNLLQKARQESTQIIKKRINGRGDTSGLILIQQRVISRDIERV